MSLNKIITYPGKPAIPFIKYEVANAGAAAFDVQITHDLMDNYVRYTSSYATGPINGQLIGGRDPTTSVDSSFAEISYWRPEGTGVYILPPSRISSLGAENVQIQVPPNTPSIPPNYGVWGSYCAQVVSQAFADPNFGTQYADLFDSTANNMTVPGPTS